jgi:hypothetical protein
MCRIAPKHHSVKACASRDKGNYQLTVTGRLTPCVRTLERRMRWDRRLLGNRHQPEVRNAVLHAAALHIDLHLSVDFRRLDHFTDRPAEKRTGAGSTRQRTSPTAIDVTIDGS